MKNVLSFTTVLFISAVLVSCSSHKKDKKPGPPKAAQASIKSVTMPQLSGSVTFEQRGDGLYMVTHVSGLKPNSNFGFHIHQYGKCEGPDYKSAGDHFNPYNHKHSGPDKADRHLGDLGNLTSDNKGHAMKELLVSPDVKDLDMIVGKAVIVHAKPDDFKTQPTGNSGGRIACGLVEFNQ